MFRAFVLLIILCPSRLFTQEAGRFELLSTRQGLSQGMVYDILQGRDGFLWIATKDGLNRYDGYRFEIFTRDPFDPFSLAVNEVWRLFEDSKGRIWITHAKGVDIFMPETSRFFHLDARRLPAFEWETLKLAETDDGAVWFSNNGSLCSVKVSESALKSSGGAYPEFQVRRIEAPRISAGRYAVFKTVYCSLSKGLLAGTDNGIYHVDQTTGRCRLLFEAGPHLYLLGEDKSGQIWFNTFPDSGGGPLDLQLIQVWVWKEGWSTPRSIPAYDNYYSWMDSEGFLWLLQKRKLYQWRPEVLLNGGAPEFEWTNDAYFVQNPYFNPKTIRPDRSGIAWLGTNGFGLVKINPVRPKFTSFLPVTSQRAVVEDPQGRLFTIVDCSQLYTSSKFDRSEANPWVLPRPDYDGLLAVAFDASGRCWYNFGKNVLCRFNAHTGAEQQLPWKGLGLVAGKNGKLYSVAEDGLSEFDPVTEKRAFFPFDRPQYYIGKGASSPFVYGSSTGDLWIIGLEGLIRASPDGTGFRFEYFVNDPANRASLSDNYVLSVADDPLEAGRYLWVGTKGGGLNRMDIQVGAFRHFKTAQGLPDNVVYGVLPDNSGHIWLSTNKGLCRFHVRDETVKNFSAADGLQDNEFNQSSFLKMRDGTLIFGGVNGLTVFHPDSLLFNQHVPQTHIVGFNVNNERPDNYASLRRLGKVPLDLACHENFLTLEFAALEFSNPSQNQYRYQLIRHSAFGNAPQGEWVDLGEKNTVQFANLSPGRYTFKVLGSNNDGLWSDQPAVLEFVIHPPWWASWWAYLCYLVFAAAIVWRLYRYQLQQKLNQQETLRLREMDDFKNRFFTNITHEFRTPLTVILGASAQLEENPEPAVRQKANLVRRAGENLLRLINQLLDLARLESKSLALHYVHGNILPFMRYIVDSLQAHAEQQQVRLTMSTALERLDLDYDPDRLLQIAYNLLSNAIKFTPAGGAVALDVGMEQRRELPFMRLMVSDTGAGIPEEDQFFIFDRFYQSKNLEKARAGGTGIGLALTRELVDLLGGEIAVQSAVGEGTVFTVHLPLHAPTSAEVSSQTAADSFQTIFPAPMYTAELPTPDPGHGNEAISVLLIEDNPDVAAYVASCLRGSYAVDFARNGQAGIEKAMETIPDLIVSDVMMPGKDGFEVVEALRLDERTSHIPIVLLTAKAGVEDRLAGLKRGADAYLSKPFHEEELRLVLNNLLELRRKWQLKYGSSAADREVVDPSTARTADPEAVFLQKIRSAIEQNLADSELDMQQLEKVLGLSRSQIFRKLKALTDKSPSQFIRTIRLQHGKRLLQTTGLTVSEIAYQVGFASVKYFSDAFLEEFGERPSAVRSRTRH